MFASIFAAILGASGWPVYAAVAGLAFAEAALFVGLVLPGETALLLGGALAARHHVSLPALLVLATAAAITGDATGYLIGRTFGPRLRATRAGRRIGPARWGRAEEFVAKRGPWAVIAGRWVGVLRALVPTAAGLARMPARSFLVANAIGGALWANTVVLLGYAASANLGRVQLLLGRASLGVAGAAVILATLAWVTLRRRNRLARSLSSLSAPASHADCVRRS